MIPSVNNKILSEFVDEETGEVRGYDVVPSDEHDATEKLIRITHAIAGLHSQMNIEQMKYNQEVSILQNELKVLEEMQEATLRKLQSNVDKLTEYSKNLMDSLDIKEFKMDNVGKIADYVVKRPSLDSTAFDSLDANQQEMVRRNFPEAFATKSTTRPDAAEIKKLLTENPQHGLTSYFTITAGEKKIQFRPTK